jgi:hypothetical protein
MCALPTARGRSLRDNAEEVMKFVPSQKKKKRKKGCSFVRGHFEQSTARAQDSDLPRLDGSSPTRRTKKRQPCPLPAAVPQDTGTRRRARNLLVRQRSGGRWRGLPGRPAGRFPALSSSDRLPAAVWPAGSVSASTRLT